MLLKSFYRLGLPQLDYGEGEFLLPLILTPVLNKPYDQHSVFRTVWAEARRELKECRRLVVGGYSFPPTDFHVRHLLRETFADKGPEDLCIINPDPNVVSTVKDLCNYPKAVTVCKDSEEFLRKVV